MSDLVLGVILGALVSIPIGIGVNIYTPRLQNYWASTSKERALNRARSVKNQYDKILEMKKQGHLFTQFLLFQLINIAKRIAWLLISSLMIIIVVNDYYAYPGTPLVKFILLIAYIALVVFTYVTFYKIWAISKDTAQTWNKVNDFEAYEKSVKKHLDAVASAEASTAHTSSQSQAVSVSRLEEKALKNAVDDQVSSEDQNSQSSSS